MRGKTSRWTREQFVEAVKNSTNYVGVVRALGLGVAGGNTKTVKKWIHEWNLDITHWNNTAQLVGLRKHHNRRPSTETVLSQNSLASRNTVKRLIRENKLLDYACSICRNTGTHNDIPLTLQLDHINGIANDHRLVNLRWLCPNCHSQTPTFAGKSSKKK